MLSQLHFSTSIFYPFFSSFPIFSFSLNYITDMDRYATLHLSFCFSFFAHHVLLFSPTPADAKVHVRNIQKYTAGFCTVPAVSFYST